VRRFLLASRLSIGRRFYHIAPGATTL
jgi:hypothetical protein